MIATQCVNDRHGIMNIHYSSWIVQQRANRTLGWTQFEDGGLVDYDEDDDDEEDSGGAW